MRVREAMTTPVQCVRATDDLAHARRTMVRHGIAHLPVVDERGGLLGVVRLADLVRRPRPHKAPKVLAKPEQAAAFMVRTEALAPGAPLGEAARLLLQGDAACAPVVEDGVVVGILTATDLLRVLGPRVRGQVQVGAVAAPGLPAVPRHASPQAVLKAMAGHGVAEVVVTEGQTFITERRATQREDAGDPLHRGRTGAAWGIVGLVNLRTYAASAWFDEHEAGGRGPKRLVEARRSEAGGPKRLRHVEVVAAVAEDMMSTDLRVLRPGDDGSLAAGLFVQTGSTTLPVLAEGAAPAHLNRRELLEAMLERTPTELLS